MSRDGPTAACAPGRARLFTAEPCYPLRPSDLAEPTLAPLAVGATRRDTPRMEWALTQDVPEVSGRYLAVDEEGTGLRATWRPARGFINLSLWRGNDCVEAFHLRPTEAARFVAFVAGRLADSVPQRPPLRPVQAGASRTAPRPTARSSHAARRIRLELAKGLERAALWLRP